LPVLFLEVFFAKQHMHGDECLNACPKHGTSYEWQLV
jgi:hypothetical protein